MAEAAATDEGWFGGLNRWASRSFSDAAESVFGAVGATDAARNLRHYRSGDGQDLNYTDEEAGRHAMIPAAEQLNWSRFESEVFTANSKDNRLNSRLLSLRDGDEPYRFNHRLGRRYNFKPEGEDWRKQLAKVAGDVSHFASNPRTYPALGRFGVASDGGLNAQRKGNTLRLRGEVAHGFAGGNLFDFNPGQTGSSAAKVLEARGDAKPYHLRFDRRQDVDAELQYGLTAALLCAAPPGAPSDEDLRRSANARNEKAGNYSWYPRVLDAQFHCQTHAADRALSPSLPDSRSRDRR